MQTTTRLIVLFVLSCSLLYTDAKHTLNVDYIVPSATNSVYIPDLETDHLVTTEANIQFIKLHPIPGSSFVVDTLGPITFDASFLDLNSDAFVSLTSGNDFNVQTQESIATNSDELNFDSDRLFMTTTNNFVINTHGSVHGSSLRQHINSLATLDIHTGLGSLALLAGDSLKFGGEYVRFDGDDRVSFYSYNTLSIDALNNFQAYAAFIDFDTYGDVYIESVNGNVEVNSVRELVFLSDEINVSAPIGVELDAEHANAHLNAADTIYIDAADLVYIDVIDEAFFTATGEINAISNADISLTAGNNINVISKYIQYTGSEMNLNTGNTILDTGGDILMRMDAIPGLIVEYDYAALENMEFISSNVIINATFISFESNLGDVDFAALDGVNSVVQFAVRDNFYGYAGETFIIGGSAVGFLSNTFHFEAADASILSSSGVNDLITLSSGDRIDATATNIKGDVEVVSFIATSSIDLNVAPGDYRASADNEIDESVFLSADNWRINAGGTVSFISTLGDSYIDTTGFLVQANSYDLTSNSDLQIVAITLAANAGTSLTWNLQQANWESQRFDVTSKLTDITLEGEIIQFWASQEGDFTADNKITINTVGDLNFAAYDDIAVSNLISLTSFATLGFEGNRYADFQARNGKLIYDNTPGEWYMSSDDNQDITWSGNFAKITATDKINLDSGFTTFAASGNLITFATDFTIDTTLQENVNLRYTDIIEVANTAPNFAVSSGNILIDVDGVNRIISEGVLSVSAASGVDINLLHPVVFHAAKNLAATASNDVLIASTGEFDSVSVDGDTTFNFNRFWKAHLEGALTFQASAGMSVDGGNDITVIQDPGVAQSVYTTISTTNYKTTLTESYTQNGGSTVLTTGQYDILSTNRILLGSFSESVFTLKTGSGVLYDASPANSNVVLTSSDLDVHTSGAVTFTGGNVLVSSDNSEYIEFEGQTLVSLTSLSDRIKWTAVYDWNVTAVAGLRYTANGKNTVDNAAIKIQNNADTFSDVNFLVRDGTTTLTSNDTQTWDADRIVLRAASDIYYKNPFAGGVSGGVLFDSQGSEHDGIYGDQAGISVRTTNANSWIWFNITLGEANINSGYDLHQIVTDSQSRFYSDNEISFLAEAGDVDIGSAGGSVVFQSTQRNVVWTTNKSTELQASGIIDTLAGKEINLFSNGPVTKFPQHDYKLGFEFSAEAGSILTQANTGFPIHFQALNFDTLSGENTHFQASDAIPIVTQNGHFYSTGETGLYYSVENGDLDLTASVNISVTSAKNEDIRVVSGLDSTWTASSKNFTSLAGINTIIRTERNSATFRTFDSLGNIAISGGGIVEFQSDGTSDVGGVNVDGIFLDAPNINSYSQDITTTEAEVLYTVGLQTRPIVSLIGGGDASFRGVQFTAEGNINQDIGQNFLINSQGSVLVNTDKDLDYLATGAVSIVSLGTNPVGKNVRFVTDGELDVSAANIQINANRRITFYADDLLSWKVTGTNPTNSYISIDVVDDLRSYVANIMDFNAADWAWTATDSFNLVTLGNVEFVNNPTGTISIYGDTNLEFVSDVNMLLETTGPNADLSLTTQLSNSNLVIQTWYQSSDILFKAVGNFVASSVNEATIDAHGPIQITAPYDDVGSATLSTIDFNSADDFSVLAAGGLTLKANDGLTLQATGVDSDFEVDSDGALNIFAWQNGVFSSVHDSLSFVTAYNFTFANQPNHGGDVVFQSTRDIIQNYGQDLYIETGDDQTYTATRTFLFNLQTAGTSYLDITTVKEDADITIAALQGPVLIHTYDNINLIGGDTYFVATTTATMTVDTLTLTTSGIHDRVQFDAKNVLNLNGGDITFATDTSTTNGLAFQDFLATGKNSAGGYSLKFTSVSNTNILASEGGVSFWADTSITSTSKTLSFVADNFFPLAGYGLAVAAADGTLNVRAHDLVVDSNANEIVSLFRDQIVLYPFETSTLEGKGASEDYEDIGLLLQSNHESSDIRIFSTDFLTADLQFRGNSLNLYAEESITMLLLDDDDTQFVGTYLWQSIGGSINVAAENEIYVQETSTGDIVFTGSGTQYFTAGDMFTITTREQLLFEANTWDVASTGSFTVNYASLDATLGSQFVVQATDALILDVEADFNVGTVNGVIQVGSGSLGEDEDTEPFLILNSNDVTTFATGGAAGNQVFITVNDGVAVDFRDGLKIPFRNAGGIVPGVTACAGNAFGGPSSLFYETNSGLLCYCDTNTLQCVQTFPVTII